MNITWTYNDAISLVPDEYTAILREDADATIEHLTSITELLAQRLGGTLSIHGLAGLDLTTCDALELLAQYPNRPRPTTAGDVQQLLELIDRVRRWAMVKIHHQTKQEQQEREADFLASIARRWNKNADAFGDGAAEIKGAALVLMYEANKIRQKVREAGSHE